MGDQRQGRRSAVGEIADRPGARRPAAGRGRRRDEGQAGRQHVCHLDAGGVVGAVVGRSQGVGHVAADIGAVGAGRFGDGQIGREPDIDGDAGRVVAAVGVGLEHRGERHGVDDVARGRDSRGDDDRNAIALSQGADVPVAGRVVIGTAAGVGDVCHAGRQMVGDVQQGDAVGRPVVGHGERVVDRVADVGRRVVDPLGNADVGLTGAQRGAGGVVRGVGVVLVGV